MRKDELVNMNHIEVSINSRYPLNSTILSPNASDLFSPMSN